MNRDNPIKVCALMLYPYHAVPGQRFRIEQWEPYLKTEGIEIDYYSFADKQLVDTMPKRGKLFSKIVGLIRGSIGRLGHLFILSRYDVIVIYRAAAIVGPAFFERVIKLFRRPVILDFDDAIWLTDTAETNRAFGWAKFSGKTGSICRLSTSVTVGNSFLADYARQFNDNVHIVPTSIDTDHYKPSTEKRENARRVVVGWTGSSTSQAHLEAFESTLADLLRERDVEIRVLSDRKPAFKGIPHTWRPWTIASEIDEISQFDIGIMPLADDDWARGKCAFKALQCMSLGIPTICSDVGANRDVIDHGKNGFLATTATDWIESFIALIDDPDLRGQLGIAARKTIVNKYSMKNSSQLFADVIKSLVSPE